VILNPALIALVLSSALISLMVLCSAYYGFLILMRWDIRSGSELQLRLERRTYLISTVLGYAFFFELVSLFLFISTADGLHVLFVGAMCAAGTLNVNGFGYPALGLKTALFVFAALWLIINHADTSAPDYPLIRVKYAFLLLIAPIAVAELAMLAGYLINLKADVITSCCGTLFSTTRKALAGGRVSIGTPAVAKVLFFASMAAAIASGAYFVFRGRGGYIFSAAAALAMLASLAALAYYISPYFYELPTHRCPFCILQREYSYAGYLLYPALFGGGVSGMGVGALMPFRNIESLRIVIPGLQQRLATVSVVLYIVFSVTVLARMVTTDFVLESLLILAPRFV
jgi:hypothetical protein